MLEVWQRVDSGDIASTEARVHVGIARTILDSLKVEIAAAHLNREQIPAVPLGDSDGLVVARPRRLT